MPNNGLKPSRYNHFIRHRDGTYVGYNFLHRTFLLASPIAFPEIERSLQSDLSSLPNHWLQPMRESRFLISDGVSEIDLIKHRYYRSQYATDFLRLTVMPTLWCNLACPYCFEVKSALHMGRAVQDALVRWVDRNFRSKRNLYVSWFGGEPLLAKPTIVSLTERFIRFCNEIGASYKASLTTNGFLLDRAFLNLVPSLRIGQIQVTFDGDQQGHDAIRKQRNGGGSYREILENFVGACETLTDCWLLVRVNCCDENYDGIPRLLESVPDIVKQRSRIFFRWVWSNTASGNRDFSTRRGKEPFQGLAELYAKARSLGWRTRNPSTILCESYCEVDYRDYYTIGPDGNVFLCSNAYDNSCEAVGSLVSGASVLRADMEDYYAMWYSASPFDDPECLSCTLLPACRGGCRRLRVEGFRSCLDEKWSLDALVKDVVDDHLPSLPSLHGEQVQSVLAEIDTDTRPDAWKLKCCAEMCCKCTSPRNMLARSNVSANPLTAPA